MARDNKKKVERQTKIRSLLIARQHMSIPELCQEFECSEATIRIDLTEMERNGLAKRVYGGVMSTGNASFNVGMPARFTAFQEEKIAICEHVVKKYLTHGQTIIIDAGTTCIELARLVSALPYRLTVLTNSLPAANAILANENHILHLAGGCYDPAVGSFHDQATIDFLNQIHADIFFMCPSGVSKDAGFASPDLGEAVTKQAMIKKAARVIVLADHSKLNRSGFRHICGLDEVEVLVTDRNASRQELATLEEGGCIVEIATERMSEEPSTGPKS